MACNGDQPTRHVIELNLNDNGLIGTLPSGVAELPALEVLAVAGNQLRRPLPGPLLEKFDRGELALVGYASEFAGIAEIKLADVHTELTCGYFEGVIQSDGSMTMARPRCESSRSDWEKGTGQVGRYQVDRIARLIETTHFRRMLSLYERPVYHAESVTITVTYRDGVRKSVRDYADAGPAELWLLKRTIAGVFHERVVEGASMSPDPTRHRQCKSGDSECVENDGYASD